MNPYFRYVKQLYIKFEMVRVFQRPKVWDRYPLLILNFDDELSAKSRLTVFVPWMHDCEGEPNGTESYFKIIQQPIFTEDISLTKIKSATLFGNL